MKAIENFIVEATNQFGSEAVITVDQAKKVLKDIKRAIGIGHLKPVSYTHLTLPTICSV